MVTFMILLGELCGRSYLWIIFRCLVLNMICVSIYGI